MKEFSYWLANQYAIDVKSISLYVSGNQKLSKGDNFWIVSCSHGDYFVKKHNFSASHSIDREIAVTRAVQKYIQVPEILNKVDGGACTEFRGDIYVLYQYINAKNLMELNFGTQKYLDILCNFQNRLIEKNYLSGHYNIEEHIEHARAILGNIKDILKHKTDDFAVHDHKYIDFMLYELNKLQADLRATYLRPCLVHGDLLKQNILLMDDKMWLIDWEKAKEYLSTIDIIRSILFTIMDPTKKDLGLNQDKLLDYISYCFQRVALDPAETKMAMDLFYLHLVTNLDYLSSVYLYDRGKIEGRTKEDLYICRWFKKNKDAIQLGINNNLSIS